jgi:hypothetical protein
VHLVTSVHFVPLLATALNQSSLLSLLHAYFAHSLAEYVGRGRPPVDIASFFATTDGAINVPGEGATTTLETYGVVGAKSIANAWLPLVQSVLVHPDDHMKKVIRTLAHFSAQYGHARAGFMSKDINCADARLPGIEILDGTLFLRVAELTMEHNGYVREGKPEREWSLEGFFDT